MNEKKRWPRTGSVVVYADLVQARATVTNSIAVVVIDFRPRAP
jgi:hypothetical protein